MCNQESTRNSISTPSSCKGPCVVWVYDIVYYRAILFKEMGDFGPVIVITTGQRYECHLRNYVILDFQQRGWVDGIIFMIPSRGCSPTLCKSYKAAAKGAF
ncbi:hypothetical protein TNCV_2834021 [Trichonephila clavipes]|nr:hypothetical protein TNCV_2834021 [Trichonephila clavipes]